MTKQHSKNRGAARRWMIGAAIAALTLGEAAASPIVITSVAQLQAVGSFGDYVLGQDIDASGVSFGPLGTFHGTFDGQGHTISNLTETGVAAGGLFSQIAASGVVSNLKLSNVSISGGGPFSTVGGITAFNHGTIHNVSVSGSLSGFSVGGIAAQNGASHAGGPIDPAVIQHADAQVSLSLTVNGNNAAGIAAYNYGSILGSSSGGSATGSGHCNPGGCFAVTLGGIASYNAGAVADSWSKLGISGNDVFGGGLLGVNDAGGTVLHSWAAGDVAGSGEVVVIGGLIGQMSSSGSVLEAYARGAVSGQVATVPGGIGFAINDAGGVFGTLLSGSIDQVYGTGAVSGSATGALAFSDVGGFAGYSPGIVATAGYWDMLSTGQFFAAGTFLPIASGLTTAQLQSGAYPAGFDPSVWYVKQGFYPQFTPFPDVPEPATLALFGAGLFFARRRRA